MDDTQNLNLPQWEADDRIMRTDFNDAMASIDTALAAANDAIPRIVTDTYTGNSAAERVIPLPSTPKAVYVCLDSGMVEWDGSQFYGGLAFADHSAPDET